MKIFKIFLISFFSLFILCFSILFFLSKKTNKSPIYFLNLLKQTTVNNQYKNKNILNFIILGLDERNDRLEKTDTTDTIIFGSLNLSNQKFTLISLPRDLWFYDLNTKINQIYPLSLKTDNSLNFIRQNFSKITGQTIDNAIIINTNSLINFTNLIGGVDVYLEKGFKDEKYPNPEYITNPKASIYKTIEFKDGWNHLDQSNITEFVRSRKSAETAAQGGTDLGRIQRQQVLIEAILSKIKTKNYWSNFSNVIGLYNFWNKEIITDFKDQNIIDLAAKLNKNIAKISLSKIEIPTGEDPKKDIIYHPQTFINKQWVFIPSDLQYRKLQQFTLNKIKE